MKWQVVGQAIGLLAAHGLFVATANAQIDLQVCDALRLVAGYRPPVEVTVTGRVVIAGEAVIIAGLDCLYVGGEVNGWPTGILLQATSDQDGLFETASDELEACSGLQVLVAKVSGGLTSAERYSIDKSDVIRGSGFGLNGALPAMLRVRDPIAYDCHEIPIVDLCEVFDEPVDMQGKTVALRASRIRGAVFFGPCKEAFESDWGRYPRMLNQALFLSLREQAAFPGVLLRGIKEGEDAADAWQALDDREAEEYQVRVMRGLFIGTIQLRMAAPDQCADGRPMNTSWIPGKFFLEGLWEGEGAIRDEDEMSKTGESQYAKFRCP